MRPTLFADHVPDDFRTDSEWLMNMREALRVLKPILPRRCYLLPVEDHWDECRPCEGRGWLYPEPPDWWGLDPDDGQNQKVWESQCRVFWRAMGILEDV